MVTCVPFVMGPWDGLNCGVAEEGSEYETLLIELSLYPVFTPFALRVTLPLITKGGVYTGDDGVGSVPSSV
jgi:hypothetical protein